jgi:hypothetical protein
MPTRSRGRCYDLRDRPPPPTTQRSVQEGRIGNPKGRPKGSKNFLTLFDKELAQKTVVNENGKKKSLTRLTTGSSALAEANYDG